MARIGLNILRYEDGQYSVNTGMGIFYTHIFVNIYVKKKKKRIFGKILYLVMKLKVTWMREIQTWDHYNHQDMLEADLDSKTELIT